MSRWKTSNKSIYNIGYHLIWCPKYRRKVLVDQVETRLKELLPEIASQIDCTIETMEIMPDHVHVFVRCSPIHAPHFVVGQLKGKSSRILRQEFPHLKTRLPTLWTRSYFAESVGCISEATVLKYIENQKNN
jgi:putative transposase